MKVLFLTNIPSPYRVDFFNELGKYCDLTVVFEKKFSSERDKAWNDYSFINFKGYFLKGVSIGTDTAISFGAIKFVKDKSFDVIICANFSSPTGLIAVRYMQRHKIKYFVETDGGTPKNGKGFKEKLKRNVISKAAGCFSTSKENDKYYIAYGATETKIFRYPFTSLFEKDLYNNVATKEEKAELRASLGIKERFIVISVGRFSYLNGYGKGYDALLRAAKTLPKDIGWYIVGGQPTEEFARLTEESGLTNIHYIDFQNKEALKKYYRASDLFVLMTVSEAWGLVINEAMACGLPIITTDKCIAGLELIENGKNGFIVSVGDDVKLSEHINTIIYDSERLDDMGKESLRTISNCTIEQMAKTHIDVFENVVHGRE